MSTTQIFIVEMGAYKRGEIHELCYMVKPQISITTSISDQHLSLFGSMENVLKTEAELIHSLPHKSISLFNGNNPATQLYTETSKRKILYKVVKNLKEKADIKAYRVQDNPWGIKFKVILGVKKLDFHTDLIGAHNVENILPAIYLGNSLGISDTQLKKAVATLKPLPKTMKKITLTGDAIGIDDTFNASPESVIAAAKYLKTWKGKKFFVLSPLIELGSHAEERHYTLGKALAFCDFLFMTNNNFLSSIQHGIKDAKGDCLVMVGNPSDIAQEIKHEVDKHDMVLFEGKEAGLVLEKLI